MCYVKMNKTVKEICLSWFDSIHTYHVSSNLLYGLNGRKHLKELNVKYDARELENNCIGEGRYLPVTYLCGS